MRPSALDMLGSMPFSRSCLTEGEEGGREERAGKRGREEVGTRMERGVNEGGTDVLQSML